MTKIWRVFDTRAIRASLFVIFVLAVVTACGGGGQGGQGGQEKGGQEVTNLRLAIGDPKDSSVGVTAEHYAELVEKKTDGQVTVEVFPDGTLFGGDQNAAVNQLGDGSLDMTIISTSVYASFEPKMNALSLPYLFADTEQLVNYLEGEPGQELLASLDNMDIEGLALMTRTFRHVTNSARPIEEPEDLQGLKIRVPQNELWVKFFKAMGANPTPMDFTEVYTALELGTIDGQENPLEVPLANKFYEVQKYLSLTGHMADGYVLGINKDRWQSLSPEVQKAMSEAAEETALFKTKYDNDEEVKIIETLQEEGMEVNELSDEQRAQFQEIARDLYPQFEGVIGEEFMSTTLNFVED